jgi:hypothetical protein
LILVVGCSGRVHVVEEEKFAVSVLAHAVTDVVIVELVLLLVVIQVVVARFFVVVVVVVVFRFGTVFTCKIFYSKTKMPNNKI